MKITPLEIRQKTFEKVFRGYDKDEVDAYLQSLSMEWERLLDENKELNHRIESLQSESNKLRELESSLYKTLKTAEDTGATLIEQAKKETDLKIKESSIQAESILSDARSKAKSLVENAESRKKQILDEMINKVRVIEGLFNQMTDLKEKVVSQVKNYSSDLMERIDKLEKKAEDLNVRDIVAEAKETYNSSMVGEDTYDVESVKSSEKENIVEKKPSKKEKKAEKDKEEPVISKTGPKNDVETETEEKIPEGVSKGMEDKKQDQEEEDSDNKFSWTLSKEEDKGKNKEGHSELGFEEMKKESKSTSKSFFDEID